MMKMGATEVIKSATGRVVARVWHDGQRYIVDVLPAARTSDPGVHTFKDADVMRRYLAWLTS